MRTISNLRAVPVLAALLISAGTPGALAAPFTLLVLDNGGGPGMLGAALRPSAGSFYASPMLSMGFPPPPAAVAQSPMLAYSSYIAMGGLPVTDTDAANPPAGIIGDTFVGPINTPTELRGVRYVFPILVPDPVANPWMAAPAMSRPGPLGQHSVFAGRLTVARGARPVCPAIFVGSSFNIPSTVVAMCTLDGDSLELLPGGTTRPLSALHARSHLAAQVTLPNFGDADVYDLYIVSNGAAPLRPPPPPAALPPPPPAAPPAAPPSGPVGSAPPALPPPSVPPSGEPGAPITSTAPTSPPIASDKPPAKSKQAKSKNTKPPKQAKPKAKSKKPPARPPTARGGGSKRNSADAVAQAPTAIETPLVVQLTRAMGMQ